MRLGLLAHYSDHRSCLLFNLFIQVVEVKVEDSSATAAVSSLDDGLELDGHWGGLETLGQIAMILAVIVLSLPTFTSNASAIKRKNRKNKKTSKHAIWKVLVLVCCCLIPFGGADSNNKVCQITKNYGFCRPVLVGDSLHTLLQALGMDQDEPFTLDKGMQQLRSLRHGSKTQDPAGIMMQVKGFAKVSTQVHINSGCTSSFCVRLTLILFQLSPCRLVFRPFITSYKVEIRKLLGLP